MLVMTAGLSSPSLRRCSSTTGFRKAAATSNRGGAWFEWFYHRDQRLERHPFHPADLTAAASRAAASLGLEVFGGDAIATRDGRVFVIDLNAWPSFALYRETASEKIASYLAARFRGHVAIGVAE